MVPFRSRLTWLTWTLVPLVFAAALLLPGTLQLAFWSEMAPHPSPFLLRLVDRLWLPTILVQLAAAGVVMAWTAEANRGLRALGHHDLRFSPGWAAGWWLVPIAALWRPRQVMKEIVTRSVPTEAKALGQQTDAWFSVWLIGNALVVAGDQFPVLRLEPVLAAMPMLALLDAAARLSRLVRAVEAGQTRQRGEVPTPGVSPAG